MATLEIKNIIKKFEGKDVLRDISFKIEDKEMMGLIGPSGCGKSTMLKIIAGIIEADSGYVLIDGENRTNTAMEKRDVVVVFQDFLLFPHMTVKENISFGLKVRREKKHIIQEEVAKLIQLVQLQGNEDKYPHELSGGQKQRVAIARALAVKPKVLLLDEPFSSLDIKLRHEMRTFIKDIHQKTESTIVIVTHDKEEAFTLCDKVGIMQEGIIMQYASPKEIYMNPANKQVAEFFGPVSYVRGEVKDRYARTILGEQIVEEIVDGIYEWVLRPEDIYIHQDGVKARVKSSQFLGERMVYMIEVENEQLLMQTPSYIQLSEDEITWVKGYLKQPLEK